MYACEQAPMRRFKIRAIHRKWRRNFESAKIGLTALKEEFNSTFYSSLSIILIYFFIYKNQWILDIIHSSLAQVNIPLCLIIAICKQIASHKQSIRHNVIVWYANILKLIHCKYEECIYAHLPLAASSSHSLCIFCLAPCLPFSLLSMTILLYLVF